MNDYKQYFIEHEKLRNRIINICMLFHQNDPELYPDIAIEDIVFVYNNKTRNVQYSAPVGMHDDSVISLSLAYQSLKEKKSRGKYRVI